ALHSHTRLLSVSPPLLSRDPRPTEIDSLSLHDALPIYLAVPQEGRRLRHRRRTGQHEAPALVHECAHPGHAVPVLHAAHACASRLASSSTWMRASSCASSG